jgi:hypothetical protein
MNDARYTDLKMAIQPSFNLNGSGDGRVVSHVKTNQKAYAPTFDCCAHCAGKTGVSHNLINHVIGAQVPSTFFLTGKWMMDHPAYARKLIAAENVEIGFHSLVHSDFTLASTNIKHELDTTRKIYQSLLDQMRSAGQLPQKLYDERMKANLFRFPSGNFNNRAVNIVKQCGYLPVQWNDTAENQHDPRVSQGADKRGNIVLMHANSANAAVRGTDTSFPEYNRRMVAGGYQPMKVSELLKTGAVQYTATPEQLTGRNWSLIQKVQNANAATNFYYSQSQSWLNTNAAAAQPQVRPRGMLSAPGVIS